MATATIARRRWAHPVKRWPTALAIGMTAVTLGGGDVNGIVEGYGQAMLLLPWPYLVGATLRRRGAAWPVLVVGIAAITALRALDVIAPSIVLVAVALIALVWSAIGGQFHKPGMARVQALGMVGFGALAVAALAADPDLGRYLVAAGWFLHGVWDFVHLRLDRVVVRSYAEWCGVLDVLVAAQLLLLVSP